MGRVLEVISEVAFVCLHLTLVSMASSEYTHTSLSDAGA
jgi:hypothetical protein